MAQQDPRDQHQRGPGGTPPRGKVWGGVLEDPYIQPWLDPFSKKDACSGSRIWGKKRDPSSKHTEGVVQEVLRHDGMEGTSTKGILGYYTTPPPSGKGGVLGDPHTHPNRILPNAKRSRLRIWGGGIWRPTNEAHRGRSSGGCTARWERGVGERRSATLPRGGNKTAHNQNILKWHANKIIKWQKKLIK